MPPRARRRRGRARALVAALALLAAASRVCAAENGPAGSPPPSLAAALSAVASMRRLVVGKQLDLTQSWRELAVRGRPALEIRSSSGAGVPPGEGGELALFDVSTGRLTSYVYTPHASARQAGEAIISLGEISARADALAGASLPGVPLALEGIRRHRASGQESVYYEARYAPQRRVIPFLEPPIRLLFDASTGRLYRFDMDPEWLDPAWPPRPRLSREAAERVAAVLLRQLDLTAALGAGAALGSTATAELFTVRPNAWLGSGGTDAPAELRPAWVVPFRLAGAGPESPPHALYVDAESGRPLGGAAAGNLEMPGR